jgi:hypothetical protein
MLKADKVLVVERVIESLGLKSFVTLWMELLNSGTLWLELLNSGASQLSGGQRKRVKCGARDGHGTISAYFRFLDNGIKLSQS